MKKVLQKAHLNGLVKELVLEKDGSFEVRDDQQTLWVLYKSKEKELFKETLGIFGLGQLVSIFKVFSDPKIKYKDHILSIEEEGSRFEYTTAETDNIASAYRPKKGEHILDKLAAIKPVHKITLPAAKIQALLDGARILKDASVMFIEGGEKANIGIGAKFENKYHVKIDAKLDISWPILVPKSKLEAILAECEGDVTIELRESKEDLDLPPIVIKEKELVYILQQYE